MSNDTYLDSYQDRNNRTVNEAEERFEAYCREKSIKFQRFGFDEKKQPVSNFFNLHVLLRSLPDYLAENNGVTYFCHVKGTSKIKLEDLINYSTFELLYCNEKVQLYVVFCFKDAQPIFKTLKEIRKLMVGLTIQKFENDNKEYVSLGL